MSGHQRGRKVRDRAEARHLVAQWKTSGLSLSEFCLRQEINVHSLSAHHRFLMREDESSLSARDFVEVKVTTPPRPPARYRVELPNGFAVTLSETFSAERLHQLLQVLQAC